MRLSVAKYIYYIQIGFRVSGLGFGFFLEKICACQCPSIFTIYK
jgi:hypothetical protein